MTNQQLLVNTLIRLVKNRTPQKRFSITTDYNGLNEKVQQYLNPDNNDYFMRKFVLKGSIEVLIYKEESDGQMFIEINLI